MTNEVSPFDAVQSELSIGLFSCNSLCLYTLVQQRKERNHFRKFGKIIYFEIYKMMESTVLDTLHVMHDFVKALLFFFPFSFIYI